MNLLKCKALNNSHKGWGMGGEEKERENKLMDMDNSVVIAVGRVGGGNGRGHTGDKW